MMSEKEYRKWLISGILELQTENAFDKDDLMNRPIRVLERIYDNVK